MTTTALPHLPLFPAFAGTRNPPLIAALEALPDYDEHETAKARIAAAMTAATGTLMTATQGQLSLVQKVIDTARADKPLPQAFAAQAAKTGADLTEARAVIDVLREADQQLLAGRNQILTAAPDALLRHLCQQLEDILDEARSLELDGVSSPQGAIDAGKVDQWQRYLVLTVEHAEIRSAQGMVTAHLVGGDMASQHLSTFGQVRNYSELFPAWHARATDRPVRTLNGEPVYDSPPWDEESPDGLWSYAVRHPEVDLWVPTARQLRDAYTNAATDARYLENAQAQEEQALPLTADQRDRLARQTLLEHQYLNKDGALR